VKRRRTAGGSDDQSSSLNQRAEAQVEERVVRFLGGPDRNGAGAVRDIHRCQCHGPLHRYTAQPLTAAHFLLPNDRKLTILVPSRTSAAICARGTFFI